MKAVTIKMSQDEIRALLELVDNQLFRMKYIDPKVPGHKGNPEELRLATAAVTTLRESLKKAKGYPVVNAAMGTMLQKA